MNYSLLKKYMPMIKAKFENRGDSNWLCNMHIIWANEFYSIERFVEYFFDESEDALTIGYSSTEVQEVILDLLGAISTISKLNSGKSYHEVTEMMLN